ncbi:MAG TPA: hypothetical protein VM869_36595 [Enhygromyxa sp.]|nr:hypothetical protein [Enhygromyxa sp.]
MDERARGPSTAARGQPPIGSAAGGETFDEPRTFAGRVEATLEAGHYTYFLLQIGEGDERWVVVAGSEHRGAEQLTVEAFARQRDFASRRLGRSFPELYFASVVETPKPGEE